MIVTVTQSVFQYLLSDPTKIRYVEENDNLRWKTIVTQTYINGLPIPKDDEILYQYDSYRGYILKPYKSFIGWLNEF